MEPAGRTLNSWIQVKEAEERSFDTGEPVLDPRKKDRIDNVEVKCDKIPKFKCDFIVDHTPTKVTSLKASKCTHRKNFKKCPITLTTKMGCTIKAFLYNKQKDVYAKGKMTIECDSFTTTAAPTTTATTTEAVYPPKKAVGDGCTCVPDFAMEMLMRGITGWITDRSTRLLVRKSQKEKTGKEGELLKRFLAKESPSLHATLYLTMRLAVVLTSYKHQNVTTEKMLKNAPLPLRLRMAV